MSALAAVLGLGALLIGATGTWSPCGFSMVETIGMRGHSGARATTLAACATFVPGAIAGGALTFGLLAVAGSLVHGSAGSAGYVVAAAIAFGAAALDARGGRIVPQVRRQLPEGWRWSMPLPVAAGLYGVLLGLGFTTFVLSFGVWALAGISFAVGRPEVGLAVGLGFGVGRALPILLLAPIADRPLGIRLTAAMAERPALYRAFRLGDAAALLAGAGALLVGTGALAAHTEVHRAADPSAVGSDLAYQRSNGAGVLRHGGAVTGLGGQQPALGGSYVAVAHAGHVEVRRRSHPGKTIAAMPARGVEALAVSDGWLAVLQNRKNRDVLFARRIGSDGQLGNVKRITRASHPSRLGHPSLDGGSLVYSVAKLRRSTIALRHLNSGKGRRLDSARRAQLLGPSIQNGHVLFVAAHRMRESSQETQAPTFVQRLVVKSIKGKGGSNTIYRRSGGGKILWTTALTPGRAYATLLAGHSERIISIRR